jgi:hypothetical protein
MSDIGDGKYSVDLTYYAGKLSFFPKPAAMLGQQ